MKTKQHTSRQPLDQKKTQKGNKKLSQMKTKTQHNKYCGIQQK